MGDSRLSAGRQVWPWRQAADVWVTVDLVLVDRCGRGINYLMQCYCTASTDATSPLQWT